MSPGPLTFTEFAAQVGPGMEREVVRRRDSRRVRRIEIGKNLRRTLAMVSGLVVATVSASWGVDGALMALAGLCVGYGLRAVSGKKV